MIWRVLFPQSWAYWNVYQVWIPSNCTRISWMVPFLRRYAMRIWRRELTVEKSFVIVALVLTVTNVLDSFEGDPTLTAWAAQGNTNPTPWCCHCLTDSTRDLMGTTHFVFNVWFHVLHSSRVFCGRCGVSIIPPLDMLLKIDYTMNDIRQSSQQLVMR